MRKLLITLLFVLLATSVAWADGISISSSVDRTEVEFGDTIQLTVSIKKASESKPQTHSFSNGGFSFSFNNFSMSSMDDVDFNVEEIPGFDIAGKRQSSQSRMINGVGESVKQIILTLVPQKEGELVIPAFTTKDSDGKIYNSEPINITVKKPAEDPEEDETAVASSNDDDETANDKDVRLPDTKKENEAGLFFKILVGMGILIVTLAIIILCSAPYIAARARKQNEEKSISSDEQTEAVDKKADESDKDSQETVQEVHERVDFSSIVASLKASHPQINSEFYKKYFEYFKKACCYENQHLSQDMTYDELLQKIKEMAGTNNIKDAAARLARDIEMVMYANSMPDRQLFSIESDIKEILNSL